MIRNWPIVLSTFVGVLSLVGCGVNTGPTQPVTNAAELTISAAQTQTIDRLARFEQTQLSRGLMRTDGGGADTPFDMRDVQRHFQDIAFYNEYDVSRGFARVTQASKLEKWTVPIRFNLVFGASLAPDRVKFAKANVTKYVEKLHRITGHPMTLSARNSNFDVLFMAHDDEQELNAFLKSREPKVGAMAQHIVAMMPRDVHCMVMAFSNADRQQGYTHAIALIRGEHPPLMQRACIEEELAQGLGLANDSPYARPSIFNDDDEFATLTSMDEVMLQMLYDPSLRPGMTLDQARPYIYDIAKRLNASQSE